MALKSLEREIDQKTGLLLEAFQVEKHIGSGFFADVYQAKDTRNNSKVALKVEQIKDKNPTLQKEFETLKILQGINGVPVVHNFKRAGNNLGVMSMELLGESLGSLMRKIKKPLCLKTVLMIGDKMITLLEQIHGKGVLHRDIKPENIMTGPGENSDKLLLVDFGLSKSYLEVMGEHIPFRDGKNLVGTARFASLNALQGKEQGRRDDLESLLYTLIYLLSGNLPWKETPKTLKPKDKYSYIEAIKLSYGKSEIAAVAPNEFFEFFSHVRKLRFSETPNYSFLRSLFRRVFLNSGFLIDNKYEWVEPSQGKNHLRRRSNVEEIAKKLFESPISLLGQKSEERKSNDQAKIQSTAKNVRQARTSFEINLKSPGMHQQPLILSGEGQSIEELSNDSSSFYSILSVNRSDSGLQPSNLEEDIHLDFTKLLPDLEDLYPKFSIESCDLNEKESEEFEPQEDRLIDKYYLLNRKNIDKKMKTTLDLSCKSKSPELKKTVSDFLIQTKN